MGCLLYHKIIHQTKDTELSKLKIGPLITYNTFEIHKNHLKS